MQTRHELHARDADYTLRMNPTESHTPKAISTPLHANARQCRVRSCTQILGAGLPIVLDQDRCMCHSSSGERAKDTQVDVSVRIPVNLVH